MSSVVTGLKNVWSTHNRDRRERYVKRRIGIVQYWGGCPQIPNAKWQRFLKLIIACSERGWETTMIWSKMPTDPELWKPYTANGCRIILCRRPMKNFDWPCIWQSYKIFRSLGCSIVHCHNIHTSPLIGSALAGVPIRIWSKLSMSPYYEQGVSPTGIHRLSPSIHVSSLFANRVLALSRAVRKEMIDQGISSTKIHILPCSVDTQLYANTLPDGFRQSLGLSDSHTLITSVGHAVPVKGWDTLIQSFPHVVRSIPQARLVLVGSMTSNEELAFGGYLKNMVERLNLSNKVYFLGQRRDIPQILKASDIFALPSRSEGMASALTEAVAAGLPCVAANVGGVPDVIVHGVNGYLFKREDVSDLAGHLITIGQNGDLRQRMGMNSLKSAQRFDIHNVTQWMVHLYSKLLERRQAYDG